MSPQSAVVDAVIEALSTRPQDFRCDEYCLIDTKTKLSFWVGTGSYSVYRPFSFKLGFWQGRRFDRALKAWQAAWTCAALVTGGPHPTRRMSA